MFIVACRRRVNGNLSDSTEMVINRRVEVSVGVTRDGLCDLTGRGMTFAILTMQEVEIRIRPKLQQHLASKCHGHARVTFPRFHRHLPKWENDEIGGQHEHEDTTVVYRDV